MIRARFLRRSIVDKLRETIPENLETYRRGSFHHLFSDSSLFFEGTFEIDDEALKNLLVPHAGELFDVENCQRSYQAMKSLTPYAARDERLWVYLTHTYMVDYSRQRWPIPPDDVEAAGYIRTHFFAKESRQIERDNSASRLWWMAHLCGRVKGMDLKTSLEVFLFKSDVRASIIERPTISQSVNLFSVIIRNLHDSYFGTQKLFERETFRQLMQEINSVGGAQLLDGMSEKQISDVVKAIVGDRLVLPKF